MSKTIETGIRCELCGQLTAREVRRPQIVGKGARMVVVENVPMTSCRHCGHDYFSAEVARMLDGIRSGQQSLTASKSIPVLEFA